MRAFTDDSVKLNRDLQRYIERALEEGRPIKIGWGQAGDEKPKNGEFGVITHLPEGVRVQCLGDLGEFSGSANLGGSFTLLGNASTMFAAYHSSGRTIVEKSVGDKVGFKMNGGEITIQGSVGDDAGAGMTGGLILVKGHAGSGLGSGMTGGDILVMGSAGSNPGIGMNGGKIVVSGSCPPPGTGVSMRTITKSEIAEFSDNLDALGVALTEDALVLEASNGGIRVSESPKTYITEGFEKIALVPNEDALQGHSPLDHFTLVIGSNSESEGVLLHIPWIVDCESASEWGSGILGKSPALVRSRPREIDMLLVDENNLHNAVSEVRNSAGMVLDTASFPGLNDAEIEGILVSLVSRVTSESLVFLKGNIGRVERLFRLVTELEAGGAIVDCSSTVGTRMAAALPRIGLATKAMKMREAGKFVFLGVDQQPKAKDLLVALASGCNGIVAPSSEKKPEEYMDNLGNQLRGWMREIGIDRIERIGRRNLCATDYDTAAISGLRLMGYDRPLPMWLELG